MTRARDLADGADKDISGTLTLDDIVLSNDMSVADNGKVQFGAGSDLEISHNGTENVIDSNAGTLVLRSAGAGTIEMRDQGSQVLAQFNDNSDVKLYHNNNLKLATTNTGVDVTGNIVATGTTGGVAKLSLVAEEVHGEIEGINIGNNFGGLAFKTNSNGTTAERMRIDSSGNVGIGQANPVTPLHITATSPSVWLNGGATGTSNILLGPSSDADEGSIFYEQSNNALGFRANASERMRIDSNGRVGIGTTPSGKFHVLSNSDVRIAGTGNSHYTYFYSNNTTAKGSIASLSSSLRVQAQSSGDLELFNTSNSGIIVKNSGNVGIGTASVDEKLDVNGNVKLTGTGRIIKFDKNGSGEDNAIYYDNTTANNNLFIGRDSSNVAFRTGGSERMRLNSSGQLGIGTVAPNKILHLETSGETVQRMVASTTNLAGFYFGDSGNGSIGQLIYDNSSDAMRFNTNGAERMRLDSAGNLLVGTTASEGPSTLSVVETTTNSAAIGCRHTLGAGEAFVRFINSNNTSVIGSVNNNGNTGTTYNTTSDIRLKTAIEPIDHATDMLMAMNPVSHRWKADPDADAVVGFIAQEMQEIVPEAVSGSADSDEMMSMDYGRITPVLVAALQDAHKKIEDLETRLAAFEAN